MHTRPEKFAALTPSSESSLNASTTLVNLADPEAFHALQWSSHNYDATPSSLDELSYEIGTTVLFRLDLVDTQVVYLNFPQPIVSNKNERFLVATQTGGNITNVANAGMR